MSRSVPVLAGLALVWAAVASAQPPVSVEVGDWDRADPRSANAEHRGAHERAKTVKAYALTVRYVTVDTKVPWTRHLPLPITPGQVLTPQVLFDAMEALAAAINDEFVRGYGLRSLGEVGVLYIDVDYDTSPGPDSHTVGVIFRPYYVRLSLDRLGDNVLPIPRWPGPTFFDSVPAPLLALRPSAGLSFDRGFGLAAEAAFSVDLLNLFDLTRIGTAPAQTRHLEIDAHGMKSLDEPFHRADFGLRYRERRVGHFVREIAARADYDDVAEPLGNTAHTQRSGAAGVGVVLDVAHNTRLLLDTGYRRTEDSIDATTNAQTNRVLLEMIPRPVYGFLRSAIWEDNGWLSGRDGAYRRLTARVGYAKEVAIRPSQTIGIEILAGAGHVAGDVPAYARFFGGNVHEQFLYDGAASAGLLRMPAGPVIRSFGEAKATLRTPGGERRGGDRFWHVNLNVALPIPPWSMALIPAEPTGLIDSAGRNVTVKGLLRRQVDVTGPSMLRAALKQEGLTDQEAAAKAKDVFEEIKPATTFIIDDASFYAVKPLLLFDAASLADGKGSDATWLAAGGGLQFTIVTTKLELGYMHTLSGPTSGSQGNFFVRLTFQNLF